jgi:predicted lipoprotein with Yx(FWY)xxD motif
MQFPRHSLFFALPLAATVLLAACGSTSTNAGTNGSTSTTTSTSSSTSTTTQAAVGLPLKTGTAMTSKGSQTVLTTSQGLTVYYNTQDTATSVFVGPTWPPVLNGSGNPTSSVSLPGTLAVQNDSNGAQVTYNGHPLYTYVRDSAPGQATGDGLGGIWFVVTPNLQAAATTSTPSGMATPTPTYAAGYGR